MLLRLPPTLHYPITVLSLLKRPGDKVKRDEAIFSYIYFTIVSEGDGLGGRVSVQREYPSKFQSTVDGEIISWKISTGDVVNGPLDAAEVDEPCAHEIQFGGMCAECGQDMTTATYNTDIMDSMRAPIQMIHDNTALTVSQKEATRMEEDAKRRLLSTRRLSLVVDLDQTVIHATVDPTVREWMTDENNPNFDAVKDVSDFQLTEDGPGMRGCWYYIKLRPGLEEFLCSVSSLFELHIYTMGTRAYAYRIAKIIDPDGKLFADRILSRDESGSLTAKNLQRLFPVDTKMVVIIDDRGDVWKWSPNLIKVSPYDFFVGIGDINSSFLPKKPDLTPGPSAIKAKKDRSELQATGRGRSTNGSSLKAESVVEVSALEQLVTMGGGDNPALLREQANEQEQTIMHQVEDRPLLQKQKELDAEDEAAESESCSPSIDESQESTRPRHHLLHDHDTELYRLQERLERVHQSFFEEYDRRRTQSLGGRVTALRGEKAVPKEKDVDLKLVPDIKDIMPQIKRPVLENVVIVFSGVLPLGTDTQNADISLWAKSFGAVISQKIESKTTHLVAGRNRTAKVREATRYPKIKIVATQWLLDSLTQWSRLDEDPYLIPVHPEDRGEPITGSSPASKDAAESSWLSSEEDTGVSLTDDEGEGDFSMLKIHADELEDADKEILKSSGLTDHSPIGYDAEQQAAVHDELKEFLGSDEEDSETDNEPTHVFDEPLVSTRKRKREESDETGNGEFHPGGQNEDKGAAARLSQRIKFSRDRSSGLRTVSNAATSIEPRWPSQGEEDVEMQDVNSDIAGPDGYPEDPDDDDDALEREMLAAFEDGGFDSNAEADVAAENG